MLKLSQVYLIQQDLDIFYEPLKKYAAVKTSDLIEEAGQVEFIFSDKTGTLTCNEMDFKKCSVNSIIYGQHDTSKVVLYHLFININSCCYY